MSLIQKLRTYKVFYELFNFFHPKLLAHNKSPYKKYGIQKPLYRSISSQYFEDIPTNDAPWLDASDSSNIDQALLSQFSIETQAQIRSWSTNGYMILRGLITPIAVDKINADIESLLKNKEIKYRWANKIMFAYQKSKAIHDAFHHPELIKVLEFLLGKEISIFQSINFKKGSQQRAHSDSVHMTTFPLGYMIAAWVALEDIDESQGPVFYYPGSHKLPYLLNGGFDHQGTQSRIGFNCYKTYEDQLEKNLKETDLKPKPFLAQKGDVLIWHPNLVHGGSKVTNQESSRKSMVAHYYANDVVKYHEISQRPSLMK